MNERTGKHVVIIGAGFTGLSAAYDLARRGFQVTVLEQDDEVGGLAGGFTVAGTSLEKFYHHWFTSDRHIMALIEELGAKDRIVPRATRTGMYFANQFFRLSTPLDLLRFSPLRLRDRIRLGLLALRARAVKDWRQLEALSAQEWLIRMGGERVYRTVWQPLLQGKFGTLADRIGAVWMWNKLKLRGGSRGKDGEEVLCYFRGGFFELAQLIAADIQAHGGKIKTGVTATGITVQAGTVTGVDSGAGHIQADAVIATPALPVIADLLGTHASAAYLQTLRGIGYLANVCLVLQLDRSLSDIYWLNVNDPGFPFVGIIEHTNFESSGTYGGSHIVYLSKYLPDSDPLYTMNDAALLEFSVPHIKRMFPGFDTAWIQRHHVWRARYAQPVVGRHYSRLIPSVVTPVSGLYIATMAQVYPEDRGTNYAVREGRRVAAMVAAKYDASG